MRPLLFAASTIALLAHAALAALPATQPTKVKLFVEAEDPREAARQITRQLGVQVRLDPSAGVVQADSGGEKPFAAAVADLLQQANLAPGTNSNGLTLTHVDTVRLLPLSDTALLAVGGIQLSAQHAMTSGNNSFTYRYELVGTLFLDPALKVMGVLPDTRADRVDANVEVMPSESGPSSSAYRMMNAVTGGEGTGRVAISFSSRTPVTKIKRLTANVRAIQSVEEASVDLSAEDVGSNKQVDGQGVSATVSVDNPDPRRATLTIRLSGPIIEKYRNGPWLQAVQRCVSMYDVNGDLLSADMQGWQPEANNSVRLRFRPNNNPTFFDDLASVKVRVPTKIKTVDLPIELKDIDLPFK